MRRTLVGIVLLTYCALGAPLARADPTVTPPRLSQDWVDPSSELVLDSDPARAAEFSGPTWQEFTQSEAFKHWMPQ